MIKTWMVEHTETDLTALFTELAMLGDPTLMSAVPAGRERPTVCTLPGTGAATPLIAQSVQQP